MEVLVDTPAWSLALRRRKSAKLSPAESRCSRELVELLREKRARLIGPVRQEILSGIHQRPQFDKIRLLLDDLDDEPLGAGDFVSAAEIGNTCRSEGVVGSPVDYLICAVALSRKWAVFTLDRDFERFAHIVGVKLHAKRNLDPVH